ncbi:MAG: hypothetical protein VKJ24_22135 [Synechococcales bacterium]|nr:hypothetical protein [Synechococcales bacterium]
MKRWKQLPVKKIGVIGLGAIALFMLLLDHWLPYALLSHGNRPVINQNAVE